MNILKRPVRLVRIVYAEESVMDVEFKLVKAIVWIVHAPFELREILSSNYATPCDDV